MHPTEVIECCWRAHELASSLDSVKCSELKEAVPFLMICEDGQVILFISEGGSAKTRLSSFSACPNPVEADNFVGILHSNSPVFLVSMYHGLYISTFQL